jgi:hypothetical protein
MGAVVGSRYDEGQPAWDAGFGQIQIFKGNPVCANAVIRRTQPGSRLSANSTTPLGGNAVKARPARGREKLSRYTGHSPALTASQSQDTFCPTTTSTLDYLEPLILNAWAYAVPVPASFAVLSCLGFFFSRLLFCSLLIFIFLSHGGSHYTKRNAYSNPLLPAHTGCWSAFPAALPRLRSGTGANLTRLGRN